MGATTIQALPYPEPTDLISAGDDVIKALAQKLDAMLPRVGDVKPSYQQGDHTGWLICDGRTNLLRASYPTAFVSAMLAAGFNGDDGTRFGIPDLRGRTVVGKGTHADVDALTDNDGQAVGSRRPKHKHTVGETPHKHELRSNSVDDGIPVMLSTDSPGGAGRRHMREGGDVVEDHTVAASTGLTVGPQTTSPTDAPAYQVANFFVYAGV